ncbi:MAG: hypothetical protein FWG17_05405 [Desulfovibrionaceae bacterium]|nr:hypothetical protein [Desulfovibrionaceae bacterium]
MSTRTRAAFLAGLFLLIHSSCISLIPERFESSLKFLANYGYVEFNFKGNVLVADAALEVQDKKSSQRETDRKLKELEQTILENDKSALGERQFRSLRYLGGNRFAAEQQVKSSFAEDLSFFQSENSPFFVEIREHSGPGEDGSSGEYTIRAFLVDEDMKAKMARLKVSQRGVFSVETDCRVIRHNAHKVSRTGSNYIYSWDMEGRLNTPATLTLRAQAPALTRF